MSPQVTELELVADERAPDEHRAELATEELLVEEVSIDGLCGVY